MPTAVSANRYALACGAFPLFFFTFLMSASSNALPQIFFQHHHAEHKTALLSLALLLATLAAVAGVLVSRRHQFGAGTLSCGNVLTTFLALFALHVDNAAMFVTALLLMQFGNNVLLDQIDHQAIIRSGGLRRFNDAAGSIARLLGMLAAPAFFTLGIAPTWESLVVAAAGLACLAGSLGLLRLSAATTETALPSAHADTPGAADRLLFGYALAVYGALFLFGANMIYLLRDHFRVAGAEARGGFAIVVVFLAAIASNACYALWKHRSANPDERRPSMTALAAPAVALIGSALATLAGIAADYPLCLAAAATIGAAHGIFLWEIRDYASRTARHGRRTLLNWFNNLANFSALTAAVLMLALATSGDAGGYYRRLMVAIVLAQTLGLVALARSAAQLRRTPT